MRLYLIAFQFLTIIPLPFAIRCEKEDMGRSMSFFPFVGLTLGALLAGCDFLISARLARPLADLLLLVIMSAVTGCLHLDGLADVCDGLAARGGRERFLSVMKDSRTGAVGVVGLVLGLLLKYEALVHIPIQYKREALLLFPMIARFSQVQLTAGAQRARSDGLGSTFITGAGILQFSVAYAATLIISYLLLGMEGLYCSLTAYLFTWFLKSRFHKHLGGITGDIIGCVSELNEILCLIMIILLLGEKI